VTSSPAIAESMAPKRAEKATAYYARVSSKTQDMRSQIPDLEAHAHAQGGPVQWYKDTFTGTDTLVDAVRNVPVDAMLGCQGINIDDGHIAFARKLAEHQIKLLGVDAREGIAQRLVKG
jgi:hypothetical protein